VALVIVAEADALSIVHRGGLQGLHAPVWLLDAVCDSETKRVAGLRGCVPAARCNVEANAIEFLHGAIF
jgi:hypothetical protein